MFVQAGGLLVGSVCVAWVGWTQDRTSLMIAMTAFGVCKGFYDSGIFAALYDVVPANSRATSAGIMNTVGWTGGALGPLYAGMMSTRAGRATEVDNMSLAVSLCGIVYLVGALSLWWAGRRAGTRISPR
jgi:MFS family permease